MRSHTKKFSIKQDHCLGLLEPVLVFLFMSHLTFAQSISCSIHKTFFTLSEFTAHKKVQLEFRTYTGHISIHQFRQKTSTLSIHYEGLHGILNKKCVLYDIHRKKKECFIHGRIEREREIEILITEKKSTRNIIPRSILSVHMHSYWSKEMKTIISDK